MKKGFFLFLAAACIMGSANLLTAQTITSTQSGIHNGFYYTFWNQGGGSQTMTLGTDGNYSVTWSDCTNFFCGKGWNPGSVDNVIKYSGSFNGGLNGYLSVYGWTQDPLVEYYIVENHGTWTPPGGTSLGTLASDGGIYNIYKVRRTVISVTGPGYWDQYWSVRTSKRSGGTVTFSNHINAWKNLGMNMGTTWEYQIVATEGYQSSGSSDITVSNSGITPSPTRTLSATPTPGVNRGDVNLDGSITIIDALMIAQYSVGLTPAIFNAAAADVNCDGNITILDALMTAQYTVGLITDFLC